MGANRRKYAPRKINRKRRPEFYVYEVVDISGAVIYVGKGHRDRMRQSMRRVGGSACRAFAYYWTEDDAYRAERERIAYLHPLRNIAKGGNGSRCTAARDPYVSKDWFGRLIDHRGTRVAAALLVLHAFKFDPVRFPLSSSKLGALRAVAHG